MIKDNNLESMFENIKSYFETYVKTYQPYKDNPVFKSILETLIDTYYKELYTDVPESLLDLVVKNVINPKTNIDYILIEIGVPEELINKLTITEKWIFFQIFADFMRYKATIQFFQMLGDVAETSFPEKFNIYELWIDRDSTGNWIFRPKTVYQNTVSPEITSRTILYNDVYNKLPSLLISEQQLQTWYENNQLILPFKSNLILLGQYDITDVSEINSLLRAAFLKEFGRFGINLYFTDSSYTADLQFVDQLWYYLLFRYYNFEQVEKDFGKILLFSTQNISVPDVSQMPSIIEQYININSWDEYESFYRAYLEPFNVDYHQSEVTPTSLYDNLYIIETDLMNYIENRLNNADDAKSEISIIMDEIYGSLLLSIINYANETYYQQYLPVYLNLLSKVIVDVSDSNIADSKTFTTKVILTLKPFHTDIILETFKAVRSQDREFFKDIYALAMKVNSVSILSISSELSSIFSMWRDSSVSIITTALFIYNQLINESENIDIKFVFDLIAQYLSTQITSDSQQSNIYKDTFDSTSLISVQNNTFINISQNTYSIDDSQFSITIN